MPLTGTSSDIGQMTASSADLMWRDWYHNGEKYFSLGAFKTLINALL